MNNCQPVSDQKLDQLELEVRKKRKNKRKRGKKKKKRKLFPPWHEEEEKLLFGLHEMF